MGMGLLAGLALFLFGIEQMTDALKVLAGDRMKSLLARLTTNRFRAVFTGAFITSQLKIPTVFLTTGPKPFHGKNTDELLRLDLSSTLLRTQFIFILAHELANQ